MAALQCEICGGKLMAKSGGIFECDSCGMQYDKTRIQEMVQEIKGTVKVEGTVEVKGTVKVDGPLKVDTSSTARNCVLRAMQIIENSWERTGKENDEVRDLLNEALKQDANCPEAHLGLLLMDYWVSNLDGLVQCGKNNEYDFLANRYYKKAEEFTRGTPLHDQLMEAMEQIREYRAEKTYQEAAALMELGAYRNAEKKFGEIPTHRDAKVLLNQCRDKATALEAAGEEAVRQYRDVYPEPHKAFFHEGFGAVLRGDGTVGVFVEEGTEEHRQRVKDAVSGWKDIVDIAVCKFTAGRNAPHTLVALNKNGRLLEAGAPGDLSYDLGSQYEVAFMKTDGKLLATVSKSNGALTVVPRLEAMFKPGWNETPMDWRNISALRVCDGRVLAFNQKRKQLGETKGDYHYTRFYPDFTGQAVWIDWDGHGNYPEVHTELDDYETRKKKMRNEQGFYSASCYGYRISAHYSDLLDYSKGEYFWAVEKNGNVLCGDGIDPKRLGLNALAMYPVEANGSDVGHQMCFLLADGSFVMCDARDAEDSDHEKPLRVLPDIRAFDGLEDLKRVKERRTAQKEKLSAEKGTLSNELSNLKGLFTGKRRREIEARLAEIEREIKELN